LYQTVFLNYEVFNRSTTNYESVILGFWVDADLGNSIDDLIGCDTTLNMFYTYNADSIDQGTFGYGSNPPAQGVMLLSDPLSRFVSYLNESTPRGNPTTVMQYNNYLNGLWRDSLPITFGDDGYDPTMTSPSTNFMFPGYPEQDSGWVLSNQNLADYRGLMIIGPKSIAAGQKFCYDLALPFARDYNGNHLSSLALLRQRAQAIQSFFDNQNFICQSLVSVNEESPLHKKIQLYPNPSTGVFNIKSEDILSKIEVFNLLGTKVYSTQVHTNTFEMDLGNQPQGVYLYQIEYINGNSITGKLILQ
jgi:hypothetical protein